MSKGPVDPNAYKALNDMKYEIANELGILDDMKQSDGSIQKIFLAGHVGGQMTKRMVEMAERSMIGKN